MKMKKWFAFFFVLVFGIWVGLVGCCAIKKRNPLPSSVSPAILSTVMLYAPYKGGSKINVASGFAITDTKIMTAGHFCVDVFFGQVAEEVGPIKVVYLEGKRKHMGGTANLQFVDERKDLCVLDTTWKHSLKPLKFSTKPLQTFDNVWALGGPEGHFPYQSEGRVITPVTLGYPKHMNGLNNRVTFSNTVTFGNSGGPLINENDEVVGVVIAKEANFDHVGFAVRYSDIRAFLDEHYGEQFLGQ